MANEIAKTSGKDIALISSKTQQWIMASINDPNKGIVAPKGYNIGNEVETAMFYIAQNTDALTKCSEEGIMSALRDMVLQGLSISKKQVYPIVYGTKLQMQRSYFGTIASLKMLFPYYEVTAQVLYQGDKYTYSFDPVGNYFYIENVESSLENRDKPIIAAFGTIYDIRTKERIYGCVMTMKEIKQNWAKAQSHSVQDAYPQEMAKRTLINRMCKIFINSTPNLSSEVVAAYNRSTEAEYDDENLQNVTPPENEIQRQKLIKGKSKGKAGLRALLDTEAGNAAESTQNAPEIPGQEITPPEPENASDRAVAQTESKPARKPSVRMNKDGEIVPAPSDDGLDDDDETMVDEDGNPMLIPF